jgi:two-component system, chemotaxis family, sensor kinase CheA
MDDFDLSGLIEDYLEDARTAVEKVDTLLLELEQGSAAGSVEDRVFSELLSLLHTLKGNSGMMGYDRIERYIHNGETILKMLREGEADYDPETLTIVVDLSSNLSGALVEIDREKGTNPDLSTYISALAERIEYFENLESTEPEQPLSETVLIEKAETEQEIVEPFESPPEEELPEQTSPQPEDTVTPRKEDRNRRYLGVSSNIVRVDFTRLDKLLNLLGELVIHRTRLEQLVLELAERSLDAEYSETIGETSLKIGSIISELQDGIMKVRMLPIGHVFSRFNRLVRDLARDHKKMIDLVIVGSDTELDKKIIDQIAEPLLHLVRNAADHGIEIPAERRKADKIAAGTITLSARQESNHIIIEVEDDGRGIDSQKVLHRARELGIIGKDEELDETAALDLIFNEGFSTRKTATETSGRGIGADVVLKTIGRLGGMVTVDTEKDRGTKFTITLPLTLAIVSAMLIESSDKLYAIPLSSIVETFKVRRENVLIVNGCEVIDLRGKIIPLLHLEAVFNLPIPSELEIYYVVIVGTEDKNVGIVCNRLIGQQEIVIKALDEYIGEVFGISGATILGSGEVVLILDTISLIRFNLREGGVVGSTMS